MYISTSMYVRTVVPYSITRQYVPMQVFNVPLGAVRVIRTLSAAAPYILTFASDGEKAALYSYYSICANAL